MKKKRCRTKRVEKKRPRQRKSAIVNELDPKTNRYYSLLLLFVTFSFFFVQHRFHFVTFRFRFKDGNGNLNSAFYNGNDLRIFFFSISIREKEICIYCTFFLSLCFSLCFFFFISISFIQNWCIVKSRCILLSMSSTSTSTTTTTTMI